MSCETYLRDQLRATGLRMTPQREIVLSVLHDMGEPVSADAVFEQVQTHSNVIDKSTVYRTLDLLQKLSMVTVVDVPSGNRRFVLNGQHGPHAHLVCRCCQAVIGVADEAMHALAQQIASTNGFVIDASELTILGVCSDCSRKDHDAHS